MGIWLPTKPFANDLANTLSMSHTRESVTDFPIAASRNFHVYFSLRRSIVGRRRIPCQRGRGDRHTERQQAHKERSIKQARHVSRPLHDGGLAARLSSDKHY
jgi:hypothetical protein